MSRWRQRLSYWWSTRTIRFRLALWYAVGGTLLLAGFTATIYFYVATRMGLPLSYYHQRDLEEVRRHLEVTADHRVLWDGRPLGRNEPWTTEYPWFELWNEKGELVGRYWPFTETRVRELPPTPGQDVLAVFTVGDDIRLRVFSVPLAKEGPGKGWTIRAMRIHQPLADPLGPLGWIIVVTLPVVVALLVVGGYIITRHWLSPLDRMVSEANQITADDLSRRLPVGNGRDELGRLATVFNDTLDRLQSSFDALDRFVADASHELRTPLTTLRSVGEVGLRRGRTVEEYREIIGSMLEEAQRLQALIQRLLELASAEGGAPVVHRTPLRIDDLVATCVNEVGILAEGKRQHIAVEGAPCTAVTDPVLFRQALQNLVDNAIKYSPDESTIRVAIREEKDTVAVTVSDHGPGISPENREHLMQRFFRPDRARGRDSGGFGLGLSITKAYMRVLGGALHYEPRHPRGSTFRLVVPKT